MRWRCRRGMRELELLLERFLDLAWDGLSGRELLALERLLELPDQLLQEYLYGRAHPSDREVAAIVARIRSAAS